MTKRKRSAADRVAVVGLWVLAALFLLPVVLVAVNSFKSSLYITGAPFTLPNAHTFVGLKNYLTGLTSAGFLAAFGRSVFITVGSVGLIVLGSSMTAWYITRAKTRLMQVLYYLFVFSMLVPFQMVMYTVTYVVGQLNLDNLLGILFVYLGFGAGLSVFMLSGFVRAIPLEIEEAATMDGCSPLQCFFRVVFPIMRPTAVTVAILNAMWVWNDYLLPYLVLGTDEKTVPVAIQISMQGAYGSTDYGGLMAMLVLAIIPIIAFYLVGQKYIIEGVVAGAVKG
ncbi:MAG: carbohydrate ABC transporter permease [Clostridia bacterium]|nr:carbohydrate ABC transporter permease [Clostridia bacterium]